MIAAKTAILFALFGVVLCRPEGPLSYGRQPEQERYQEPQAPAGPAQYDFTWLVNDEYSGNDFGQQEARDGYDTQGSYYVLLPDGRKQTVTYYVNGDSGYVADVKYEGEAQYPEQQSYQPQPQPRQQYQLQPQQHQPQPQQHQPQPQQQQFQPQPQQQFQPEFQFGYGRQ